MYEKMKYNLSVVVKEIQYNKVECKINIKAGELTLWTYIVFTKVHQRQPNIL